MKEENWDALGAIINVLKTGMDTYCVLNNKGNLTDSTAWYIGEDGGIKMTFNLGNNSFSDSAIYFNNRAQTIFSFIKVSFET